MPRVRLPVLAFLTPAALVLIWALVAWRGVFPPSVFPRPWDVARGLWIETASGRLLTDVLASLFRVSLGFLLAVALGVPSGLLLGHSRRAREAWLPIVNFFRSLSPLDWILYMDRE